MCIDYTGISVFYLRVIGYWINFALSFKNNR